MALIRRFLFGHFETFLNKGTGHPGIILFSRAEKKTAQENASLCRVEYQLQATGFKG